MYRPTHVHQNISFGSVFNWKPRWFFDKVIFSRQMIDLFEKQINDVQLVSVYYLWYLLTLL